MRHQAPGPSAVRMLHRLRRWRRAAPTVLARRDLTLGLQRLADTLRTTPLDGRFWVVGGLLLGWARDGRPLASDLDDADFAYLDEDHERFLASVPALIGAGFVPRHRFTSHDGRHVEHRFRRGRVQYDFFRLDPAHETFRYSLFVDGNSPHELIARVPLQPRVAFSFVGREWLKVADHELALRSIYGDWRTEHTRWTFESDRAVVERIPLEPRSIEWDGSEVSS